MKIILTGGGTGGHIVPIINIGKELERMGDTVLYVGSKYGIEKRIGIPFKRLLLPMSGWVRRNLIQKIVFFPKALFSKVISLLVIWEFHPDIVLTTGGFVSIPIVFGSFLLGKKIYLIELNSIPGLGALVFSRISKLILLPMHTAQRYFKKQKVILIPPPINLKVKEGNKKEGIKYFNLDSNKKTIFIFGGSRGAKYLIELGENLAQRLRSKDFQFIIQGKAQQSEGNVKYVKFIERMDLAYSVSDVVISRAGAMTIFELMVVGLPAILIPYPYSYMDHQYHNAEYLKNMRKNIYVLREKDVDVDTILSIIQKIAGRRQKVKISNPVQGIVKEIRNYVW